MNNEWARTLVGAPHRITPLQVLREFETRAAIRDFLASPLDPRTPAQGLDAVTLENMPPFLIEACEMAGYDPAQAVEVFRRSVSMASQEARDE